MWVCARYSDEMAMASSRERERELSGFFSCFRLGYEWNYHFCIWIIIHWPKWWDHMEDMQASKQTNKQQTFIQVSQISVLLPKRNRTHFLLFWCVCALVCFTRVCVALWCRNGRIKDMRKHEIGLGHIVANREMLPLAFASKSLSYAHPHTRTQIFWR